MRKPKAMPRNPVPASEPTTVQITEQIRTDLKKFSAEFSDALAELQEWVAEAEGSVKADGR